MAKKKKPETIRIESKITGVTLLPDLYAKAHETATAAGWLDWNYTSAGNGRTVVIEKIK